MGIVFCDGQVDKLLRDRDERYHSKAFIMSAKSMQGTEEFHTFEEDRHYGRFVPVGGSCQLFGKPLARILLSFYLGRYAPLLPVKT